MHMHSYMRAYVTVQKLLCHASYCERILSLARASYRLSFAACPPAVSTKSVAWRCSLKKSAELEERAPAESMPWVHLCCYTVLLEILVQFKQKRGPGVENPPPRSFWCGLLSQLPFHCREYAPRIERPSSSVPFAGLELTGLNPAKCPAKSPAKNIAPRKSKLRLINSSLFASAIFARPHHAWNVFNNIWKKKFNHDLAGQKSPKPTGRNLGVRVKLLHFLCGALRGLFCGAEPCKL